MSGLEPLTCSSYEFAAVHAILSYFVQQCGLFMRLLPSLVTFAVRHVLLCTSPVAVRLG